MKALAQKNSDGSYTVRVFSAADRSTDVVFPYDSYNKQLAVEYAAFKNAQEVSGPNSPATRAVLADAEAMAGNDLHEQLMATMEPSSQAEIDASKEAHRISRMSPEDQATAREANRKKATAGLEKWREEQRRKKESGNA